jgi:aminopeptidase YwaD
METEKLHQKSVSYLKILCEDIKNRSVGSTGNRQATDFFNKEISSLGWNSEDSELNVIDWEDGGATLQAKDKNFKVLVSPYSLDCNAKGKLTSISNIEELERTDISGKIILLYDEIAKEQLMPKNFIFYNPEEHQRIVAFLEKKKPVAIVSVTGRNAALAGGIYPFPLIEDGDFDIPSVYMTEEEGRRLLPHAGESIVLKSHSRRIPTNAYNIIARKGKNATERIVITAHIDTKKGTPGAIDNATGVIVLLLVAEMLGDYDGNRMLEIVALNGEDYYSVPGQMDYIYKNQNKFNEILLNVNIDGAGYIDGKSIFSLFGLPEEMKEKVNGVLSEYDGITEGILYPQGDHSIFIQNGCPAIAISSKWLIDHMNSQAITHTPNDNAGIVDCRKVVEIAEALNWLIRKIVNT